MVDTCITVSALEIVAVKVTLYAGIVASVVALGANERVIESACTAMLSHEQSLFQ